MTSTSAIYRSGGYEAHEREFSLVKAGETVAVEPKAFRVLVILLRNPRKLIPKEELLNAVWGDAAVTENSLTRAIALLRRLLGDDAREPRFIETVTTVGYRWLCPVERVEDKTGDLISPEATIREPRSDAGDASGASSDRERLPRTKGESRRARILVAVAALVLLLTAGYWYWSSPLPPPRITSSTQLTNVAGPKVLSGTDGSRLYFYFDQNSPDPVAQVSVSGGEVAHIPIALRNIAGLEDVSPDGSSFLISSNENGNGAAHTQWNVRVPGGSVVRMPDAVTGNYSPDGATVIYSTPQGDICLVQSDGTGARKIAHSQGIPFYFAWKPDGSAIRYTVDGVLWEMSADGQNQHKIFPGWQAVQCCGRWTPDGNFFLFRVQPPGSDVVEIWAHDERHTWLKRPRQDPIQLATGPILWGTPLPGRDGKKIFADGATLRGELTRFDSRTQQFQPYLGGISVQGVTFSPDGRSIAYVKYPEGTLWKTGRDGSHPVQLSSPPLNPFLPRWSPDGNEIAFTDLNSNPNTIWVVASSGGVPRRLLPEIQGPQSDPGWSPGGNKIVYSAATNSGSELFMFDRSTRKATHVPQSDGAYSPRWSPDGRFLAAISSSTFELRIYDLAAQRWTIVRMKDPFGFPNWSHDSQFIYYAGGNTSGDTGIFRVRPTGGSPERIAILNDMNMAGWFSTWMGLDDTDEPILLRDVGSNEIYALTFEVK